VDTIILLLTPFEMLLVNLFVIHQCSQRKYGKIRTYLIMGLSVIALMIVGFLLASQVPGFGSGNGLFIFCGFLFILPIKYLYRARGVSIVTVACFSWSYTFLLFALSAKLARMIVIPGWDVSYMVLLIQTVLYLGTFVSFYRMIKSRFLFVLEHIGKKEAVAFMWMTLMWFWILFILNLSFSYPEIKVFQIVTFLTLAIGVFSSFLSIYLRVTGDKKIQNLEKLAYQDDLTQLRNRVVLTSDAEDLVTRKIPFHLIYFDLNYFKSINDRYGHTVGDKYLAFFAHEIKTRIGNEGGFYRVAGDEFVCIVRDGWLDTFIEQFETIPNKMANSNVQFLGFCYGVAHFPTDGDTTEKLIEIADDNMYKMKRDRNV